METWDGADHRIAVPDSTAGGTITADETPPVEAALAGDPAFAVGQLVTVGGAAQVWRVAALTGAKAQVVMADGTLQKVFHTVRGPRAAVRLP